MVISDGCHRLIHEKSKTTIYGVGGYFGKTVDYTNKSSNRNCDCDNHQSVKITDTIIHGCKVKKILRPKTAGQPSHFDIFRPRKDRRPSTSLQLPK
jgi:hypothetical protein